MMIQSQSKNPLCLSNFTRSLHDLNQEDYEEEEEEEDADTTESVLIAPPFFKDDDQTEVLQL